MACICLVSGFLHWLAVRNIDGPWIVPDELIYAARGIAFWHHGPFPLLHGSGTGYGLLYPLVAGVPLSVGRTTQAYGLLQFLQPFVVSLAAVPVFFYARRVMPAAWALVAAALTAASPLLLYSGFVMTEVLFYPVAALTLFAIARAVETGTYRDQGIALALVAVAALTRTQGVALALVLPAAAAIEALMSRDLRRLRAFWPGALVLGLGLGALAVFPGLLGAYGETLRGAYPFGSAMRLVFDHLAYVAVSVAVLPFAAFVTLAVDAMRGNEASRGARALLAVTLTATVVCVLQVGFFAARYAPHLLGRDLAPLPPLFFTVFALWLSRGARRSIVVAGVGVYALLAVLLLAPWNSLVNPDAFADTFDLIVISKLPWSAVTTVMVLSVAAALAFLFLPRRVAVIVLPLVTLAALVASSVVAAHELTNAVRSRRVDVVGSQPDWIDRAARGPVAYVYGGEQLSSAVWLERFWNRRINQVITLGGMPIPGPIEQTMATLSPAGVLPTRDRYVVAPDRFALSGVPIAHLAQTGLDISGLTLWQLTGPPSVSTITAGIQANGDIASEATVSVYDCRKGRLQLTLIPKATNRLRIALNGRTVVDQPLHGPSWTGEIPVPSSPHARLCTFTIFPQPLLGSTRISFSRA